MIMNIGTLVMRSLPPGRTWMPGGRLSFKAASLIDAISKDAAGVCAWAAPSPRRSTAAALILSRLFGMVDYEDLYGPLLRFEFEAELLLQRGID